MKTDLNDLERMNRRELLKYIEELESKAAGLEEKMEDLKAQASVLKLDIDEFKVEDVPAPELHISEQTADALAEAASIFDEFDKIEVEPAPVRNGVVKLGPVTEEEAYIPVVTPKKEAVKKPLKVKVKKKR